MTRPTGQPELDRAHFWIRVWRQFWIMPAIVAGASVVLGAYLPTIDGRITAWVPYLFESGPDGARQLLGTIASAMISLTGLVFSLTMVVLQLASSQFSPRLLGHFLQSRVAQLTLGVFTGSFLYSLTVLRVVRSEDSGQSAFVPQGSVTLAFGYVIASVAFFVAFIHHVTESVQVSYVVNTLGIRTRITTKRLKSAQPRPATWSPEPGASRRVLVYNGHPGFVVTISSTPLAEWALANGCVVALDIALGDALVPGDQLGLVWGADDELDLDEAAQLVVVAGERSLEWDYAYGMRQLTDVADRALSPAVNDPTTAVNVVYELYAVLRPLVGEPDPSPVLVDAAGRVGAVYRPPDGGCSDEVLARGDRPLRPVLASGAGHDPRRGEAAPRGGDATTPVGVERLHRGPGARRVHGCAGRRRLTLRVGGYGGRS